MRYALNKNKYLLPEELAALEDTLEKYMATDTRNCLVILTCLKTGGRAQEVLNLTKASFNASEQSVLIQGLKGSNDREIPLRPTLFKALQRHAETVDGDRVFPITYNRLLQIWQLYRPVPKKLHSLRHTFAIQIYKKTKDIRLVQVALGHRNVMNTMIYADYVYSQNELRKLLY